MHTHVFVFVLAAIALPACSTLASIEGGYQQPYNDSEQPGHRGATINIHFGVGGEEIPVGMDMSVRTKHGSHQGQWALGGGMYAFTPPAPVGAFARIGLNLLSFETYSGHFAFGMGSPWAQGGIYLLPTAFAERVLSKVGGLAFFAAASTGYDLRFTSAVPDTGWWALTVGVGFLGVASRI